MGYMTRRLSRKKRCRPIKEAANGISPPLVLRLMARGAMHVTDISVGGLPQYHALLQVLKDDICRILKPLLQEGLGK